jgi:histidinol-phosphate aminotransferase
MQRRTFLQTGVSAGLLGASGLSARARPVWAAPAAHPPREIRLSSNENPLGISPRARQAILSGIADANRYPQLRTPLIDALAAKHGVRSENIVLGAGSTEVLKMAVEAFTRPAGRLVLASPTYEDAEWYAGPSDLELAKVPLTPDLAHDLHAMRERAASAPGPVCVYVCNPNNPTGTLTPSAAIDDWIASAPEQVSFVVDEAYFDFVTDPSYHTALRWIAERPGVVVARTFSKVYGMAGVRLGYGIAHPDTASRLRRLQVRNNANHFALVAGRASLEDETFVRRSISVNERGKRIAQDCLRELEIEVLPTHTNFLMHRIQGNLRTHIVRMRERGIRVGRPFPPMLEYNRVSIGLPEEMERFAEALRAFRQAGWI